MRRYIRTFLSALILLVSANGLPVDEAAAGDANQGKSSVVQFVQLDVENNGDFDEFEDEFSQENIVEVFDPLSSYNRLMTRFNTKLYDWVLKPAALGYNNIVPKMARIAVSRFFDNLLFPIRFVNNLLQVKIKGASIEFTRFTLNTTIGFLGFFDPANAWLKLQPHREDFGQTLGFYGAPGGFHIVLPFFGPSNLRDTIGSGADRFLTYSTYAFSDEGLPKVDAHTRLAIGVGVESYERLNETSLHLEEIDSLKNDALDMYILMRDAYEQNRKMKIRE